MANKKELIAAAELLQEWCKKDSCLSATCPFYEKYGCSIGQDIPEYWHTPPAHKWTEADIALAKAYKDFAVNNVARLSAGDVRGYQLNGQAFSVPSGAFESLEAGESILIDEIIAQGEDNG